MELLLIGKLSGSSLHTLFCHLACFLFGLLCRYWRELHALNNSRCKVKPLARLRRQRSKAVNLLRLTPLHLASVLAAVVRRQFDDVDVGQ